MSQQIAERFIEALRSLERERNVEPLVALYTPEAAVGNVLAPDGFQGTDGARQFWTEYRGTFGDAESEFRNVIVGNGCAGLEWMTSGTGLNGEALQYSGVTILETSGERVSRSCAYFDAKSLGRQIEPKG